MKLLLKKCLLLLPILLVLSEGTSAFAKIPDLRICRAYFHEVDIDNPDDIATRLWTDITPPDDRNGIGPYLRYFFAALVGLNAEGVQKAAIWRALVPYLKHHHRRMTRHQWYSNEYRGADGSVIFVGAAGTMVVFAPTGELFRGEFPIKLFKNGFPAADWTPDYSALFNLKDLGN